jgi:ornithine decarboxylase
MKAKFHLRKSKLIEQYETIKKECDIVSYSLKTNYEVGEILEDLTDCWISVHFIRSLEKIKDKSRILFFAQAWNVEDLDKIISKGVRMVVIDNEGDLQTLLEYLRNKEIKITLFLRMRMKEHTIHTGKHFVFGLNAKRVNQIILEEKNNPNLEALGIHFHRKTQNIHEWSMQYELKDSLTEETLNTIHWLNIGGGMPVKYKNSRAERLKYVFTEIKKLREWLKPYNIKLITEPGRYLAAPAIKLNAQITAIYNNNIILNCSVYNAAMDTFIANVRLEVDGECEKGHPYTIKGCTPDSMDIFRYRAFLDNPKVGDTLTFLNAGAYNFNSNFCNVEKIETIIEE